MWSLGDRLALKREATSTPGGEREGAESLGVCVGVSCQMASILSESGRQGHVLRAIQQVGGGWGWGAGGA